LARSWLDRRIPEALPGGELARRRAKAIWLLTVVCASFSVVPIVTSLLFGMAVDLPIMCVSAVGFGAIAVLLERTWNLDLCATLVLAMAFVAIGLTSLRAGGLQSPYTIWLMSIPLVGVNLMGGRGGLLGAGVAGGIIAFLALGDAMGWSSPNSMTPLQEQGQRTQSLVLLTSMISFMLVNQSRAHRIAAENAAERAAEAARLEMTSKAKSEFMASVSHEIRTPLNGVLGLAEVLAGTELTSEQRSHVEAIRGSGTLLLTLLNDVLDSAKLEAERMDLEEEPLDLRVLADQVLNLFAPQAKALGIGLTMRVAPSVPVYVLGDSSRTRQVVMNLVGNAVKFTKRGGIRVEVSSNGSHWTIAVSDDGIGIAADRQAAVFEPFRQAEAGTTRRFGGTGLGLSISKRLVELMGGRLRLDSELGVGSTFSMDVPLRVAHSPAPREQIPVSIKVEPLRILVAEDNRINQRVLRMLLERDGHTVDVVENGVLALEAARERAHDLILMDFQMPEMDGLEATRRIRAFDMDTCIVALTANASAEDRRQAFASGMDDFLTKPIEISELKRVLSSVRG